MKTIEEKAKAYDEALEKARQLCAYPTTKPFVSDLQDLFPELAEFEDEKIRNGLVRHLEELLELGGVAEDEWDRNECEKYIDWLEKQGEKDILEDAILDGNEDGLIAETIRYKNEKQVEKKPVIEMKSAAESIGVDSETYNKIVDECIFDEQKPADKVEPKFKVGDWVMLDRPVLITKVEDMPYNTHQYWTSDGTWFGDATKSKLWTTQDAKDGDVLISDYEGGICIAILKSVVSSNEIEIYCHLINSELFIAQSGFSNAIWHPATKEQRDTLMKAMADAGYTFDFEKKELLAKKIKLEE